MRLNERIKNLVNDHKARGKRAVYLVMSPEKYRLLVHEASEWLVRKPIYELEMFYGCYIVVADVPDIEVVAAPWEQVRSGK